MADNKKSSLNKRSGCYLLNIQQPDQTSRRLKLSMQRSAAVLFLVKGAQEIEAAVGFLDVSSTGAGVFTTELLHKGTLVELKLSEPFPLKVRGIVSWSVPVKSKIYAGKFHFRSGLQFIFDGEEQKKAVQDFIQKVAMDPIESLKSSLAAQVSVAATPPVVDPKEASASAAAAPAVSATPASEVAPAAGAPAPVTDAAAAPAVSATPAPEVAPAAAAPAPAAAPAASPGSALAVPSSSDGGQQAA